MTGLFIINTGKFGGGRGRLTGELNDSFGNNHEEAFVRVNNSFIRFNSKDLHTAHTPQGSKRGFKKP